MLRRWLLQSPDNGIKFVYVPSKSEWGIHKEAHDLAMGVEFAWQPNGTKSWD